MHRTCTHTHTHTSLSPHHSPSLSLSIGAGATDTAGAASSADPIASIKSPIEQVMAATSSILDAIRCRDFPAYK